jgi:hypothetical protein
MALPPFPGPSGPDIPLGGLDPPPGSLFDPGPPPPLDPVLAAPLTPPGEKILDREKPDPPERRKALVDAMTDMVKQAKNHWDKVFKRMEADQRFAAGVQWKEDPKVSVYNDIADDDLYIANITLRHIQQRVAAVYAKNPQAVCRRRARILSTVWDGTMESLQQAQGVMQQAQQVAMMGMSALGQAAGLGMPGAPPGMPPGMPPMGATSPGAMAGAPPPDQGAMPSGDAGGSPGAPGPEGAPGAAMPPMPMPMMPPPDEIMQAQAVIEDAQSVKQQLTILNKISRTLEILYEYEVSEQQQSFKSMMKMTVRRAATSGTGWIRLGFQRLMAPSPDKDSRIADIQAQLELMDRISADIADDEEQPDSAAAEQLRLTAQAIADESDVVMREGLLFSWPKSTAIIPDPRCVQLRDFLGCDWAAEEFLMTVNEIQETYKVDVSKSHNNYERTDTGTDYERARQSWQGGTSDANISSGDSETCLVWEFFNKKDGLVYVICDGYPDFLREPAAPDVYTDRFWPWFLVAFNELPGTVFPVSDVSLIRPMQRELNRSRQGLREHRIANRPKIAYAEGTLSEEDIEALKNHPVNALIALAGLQPGQDVNQLVQAIKGAPIDPNLYEVNPVFQDMQRTIGDQEADLGGTAGDTATESSIAASAKATAVGSSVDDIDETLTTMARCGGQILLLNVQEETVKSIVGPGAMWPMLTKAEVARDLYLEIKAGSSGRPNQQQELQNFERLAPILMQLPGVKPSFLVKQALTRLDDKVDVDEAIADGLPSVTSMNAGKIPGMPGQGDPNAQGPQGANNAPAPPQPASQTPGPPQAQPEPPSASPTTRLQ